MLGVLLQREQQTIPPSCYVQVAEEYGCEMTAVEKETEAILEEIGHKLGLPSVRFVALLLRGVLRRVLSGIYVNKAGLSQVSSEWTLGACTFYYYTS